ncbi:MAG: hypothetical protein R3D05_11505 [Dongiaceae bacterium]
MSTPTSFIAALENAAKDAGAAETAYRREAAERIKHLDRARSFAFRRLNLLRPIVEAVGRAESEEMAVASGLALLRAKLGWSSDSEARTAILDSFTPLIRGIFADQNPEPETPPADLPALLAEFERWYEETHRKSFWDLLDQPMPETPLVDF